MKKLILGVFLLCFIAAGNSQILLEEAKVEYRPISMKLDPGTNSLTLHISEKEHGEFEKDPISFMKANFDSKKFVEDNNDVMYSSFEVTFQSSKGYLQAFFNSKGDLIKTSQKFKNVELPYDARLEIVRLHKDAVIKSNKYFAYSKGWDLHKEYYKVKYSDGTKNRRVRINRNNDQLSIAGL